MKRADRPSDRRRSWLLLFHNVFPVFRLAARTLVRELASGAGWRCTLTPQERANLYVSRMPIAVVTASLGGHPSDVGDRRRLERRPDARTRSDSENPMTSISTGAVASAARRRPRPLPRPRSATARCARAGRVGFGARRRHRRCVRPYPARRHRRVQRPLAAPADTDGHHRSRTDRDGGRQRCRRRRDLRAGRTELRDGPVVDADDADPGAVREPGNGAAAGRGHPGRARAADLRAVRQVLGCLQRR